ncbi:MAG: serine O-acetyltransferase, partial [Deltaproteobacteria bacterium]
PTLGNNVIIGSGAKILGPFKVGDDSKIGSNSVVVKEVPPTATVVGIPGRVVISGEKRVGVDLQHGKLPDPVAKAVSCVFDQLHRLEDRVEKLQAEQQQLQTELAHYRKSELEEEKV